MSRGTIRKILISDEAGELERLLMVLHAFPDDGYVIAAPIRLGLDAIADATSADVIFPLKDSPLGEPFTLQTDLRISILLEELVDEVIADVGEVHLHQALNDSSRQGTPLGGPDDPRWKIKVAEGRIARRLAYHSERVLIGEP